MQLRPHQNKLVTGLSTALRDHRKVLGQGPTGFGKTVIFSAISHRYTSKHASKSVLILVHRKELLQQTRNTLFRNYDISAELIVAGKKYIHPSPVYIGMVESVNRRIKKLKNVGLVIIDECHIGVFNKMHLHFPDQLIIGFTATPISSSKKFPLNLYYEKIVQGPQISELIKEGFLCQNITRAPKEVVDRVELASHMKNGEFDESYMASQYLSPRHVNNTVRAYQKWCAGEKTIIFNVNVAHSLEVTRAFLDAGLPCKHLDGEMEQTQRRNVLNWFKSTPNAILCNIGILTAGFDEPTIQNVIVNKATKSLPLWCQMTGRGSRFIDEVFIQRHQHEYAYPLQIKNHFGIIDMGGNALDHGDWCDDRDWEYLFNNPQKPGEGVAPVKSCPECEGILHASARVCDCPTEDGEVCGYLFPVKERGPEDELNEFTLITKNIDPEQIIADNKDKKDYYGFFNIGVLLAREAAEKITEITDEKATFILQNYFDKGKEWAKKISEKRLLEWESAGALTAPFPKPKKIIFSPWHKEKAQEHLFKLLKNKFPSWQTELSDYTTTLTN